MYEDNFYKRNTYFLKIKKRFKTSTGFKYAIAPCTDEKWISNCLQVIEYNLERTSGHCSWTSVSYYTYNHCCKSCTDSNSMTLHAKKSFVTAIAEKKQILALRQRKERGPMWPNKIVCPYA